MKNKLQERINGIFELPPEEILGEWVRMFENRDPSLPAYKYGKRRREFTDEIVMDTFLKIKQCLFKTEVVMKHPSAIIEFMHEYSEFSTSIGDERWRTSAKSVFYQDANAFLCLDRIKSGRWFPTADPYFEIDPEDPIKVSLNHGIQRGLYSREEVDRILNLQVKTSVAYRRVSDEAKCKFENDHTPFAKSEKGLRDFGFHIFMGRTPIDGKEDRIITIDYEYGIKNFGKDASILVPLLYEAVRKQRKVLFSRSPGEGYEVLTPEQNMKLFDQYYDDPKRARLPNPFALERDLLKEREARSKSLSEKI
jgi:hypothetical protein